MPFIFVALFSQLLLLRSLRLLPLLPLKAAASAFFHLVSSGVSVSVLLVRVVSVVWGDPRLVVCGGDTVLSVAVCFTGEWCGVVV